MRANALGRRRWTIALAGSFAAHALIAGLVKLAPVPSYQEEPPLARIAVLRITKAALRAAHAPTPSRTVPAVRGEPGVTTKNGGRLPSRRGRIAAAATAAAAAPKRTKRSVNGAAIRGAAGMRVPGPGRPAAGSQREPSPAPEPTLDAEMLARLNERMRAAIPSGAPAPMKRYDADLATLTIRPDPNRLTAANYPLPTSGLFAHARIARTATEAIAVRAIEHIGKAYVCIGYLAKVRRGGALAGPYIGPCKAAWREQLGITTPAPRATPSASPPAPSPSPSPDPSSQPARHEPLTDVFKPQLLGGPLA